MRSNGIRNPWTALVLGAVATTPLLTQGVAVTAANARPARAVATASDAQAQLALGPRQERMQKQGGSAGKPGALALASDAQAQLAFGPRQERLQKNQQVAGYASSAFAAEHARVHALALSLTSLGEGPRADEPEPG